jgi:hypothetical protein
LKQWFHYFQVRIVHKRSQWKSDMGDSMDIGELRNYGFWIELLLNRCKSKVTLDRVTRCFDHSALYNSVYAAISARYRVHNSLLCSKLVSLYLLVTLLSYSSRHPFIHTSITPHLFCYYCYVGRLTLTRISSRRLIWAIRNCFQTRNPLKPLQHDNNHLFQSQSALFTGMQGGPNQGCNSLAQHVGSISNNTVSWLWSTTSKNSAYIYPQHDSNTSGILVPTTPNVTSINTFDTSTKSDLQDPPANQAAAAPSKISVLWLQGMAGKHDHFVLDSKLLTELHITRNLCAHPWLKQLAPHGSLHKFKRYRDSLGKERQQVS